VHYSARPVPRPFGAISLRSMVRGVDSCHPDTGALRASHFVPDKMVPNRSTRLCHCTWRYRCRESTRMCEATTSPNLYFNLCNCGLIFCLCGLLKASPFAITSTVKMHKMTHLQRLRSIPEAGGKIQLLQ
jgi:hypothetical protein